MIAHNCQDLVENVPFFADADSDFVENIIQTLNFEMYLMDDEIIKEGTFGRKMFFISRGTVRVSAKTFSVSQCKENAVYFNSLKLYYLNSQCLDKPGLVKYRAKIPRSEFFEINIIKSMLLLIAQTDIYTMMV